jgi:hypothetical protein
VFYYGHAGPIQIMREPGCIAMRVATGERIAAGVRQQFCGKLSSGRNHGHDNRRGFVLSPADVPDSVSSFPATWNAICPSTPLSIPFCPLPTTLNYSTGPVLSGFGTQETNNLNAAGFNTPRPTDLPPQRPGKNAWVLRWEAFAK